MKKKAILIVDDVELNRAILCELFQNDYEVLEAEDGLVALHIIEKRCKDLAVILLDVIMPIMDGFQVLTAINSNPVINFIPVIMITAENSENAALRSYELGVCDIINKPFSPSVVHRRVENIIELYQHRSKLKHIVHSQKTNLSNSPQISKRVLWLLELEREKYRLLSEMSGDVVFNYNKQDDVIEFTGNYQAVFGGETKLRNFKQIFSDTNKLLPEDYQRLLDKLPISSQEGTITVRIQILTAAGVREWFELYVNAILDKETGECAGYLGKIVNINDMKSEAEHWRKEAYHDPLTQLYNRKAIEELSFKCFNTSSKRKKSVLFFIDIDNFKQLNDQIGHLFGDEILRYVGNEMRRKFRTSDIVARVGGDEFVVLLNSDFSRNDIIRKANELCAIFRNAPHHKDLLQPISGSVGIACCPDDGLEYKDLLEKADQALYYAKSQGKNRYAFYTDKL